MNDHANANAIRYIIVLSALAFVLHFAWEMIQCPLFFEHGSYEATWQAMMVAAAGDVGLTWLIYGCVAVVSWKWRWSAKPWSWLQLTALHASAFGIAVAVEWRALSRGAWTYSDNAPILPLLDVSMIPIMQLMLLTPLVLVVAERLVPLYPLGDPAYRTEVARLRYERIAPIYDVMESLAELSFRRWRPEVWSLVDGKQVLEIGVGTGKNFRFYPKEAQVSALDISERMVNKARARAKKLGIAVQLEVGDAQRLSHADNTFDVVIATFVFCSVPDAALGLREAHRVLRPGGKLLLLEHVLSKKPILRGLMRLLDFIPARMWGSHINRDTESSVEAAEFSDIHADKKLLDIVKIIRARALEGTHDS